MGNETKWEMKQSGKWNTQKFPISQNKIPRSKKQQKNNFSSFLWQFSTSNQHTPSIKWKKVREKQKPSLKMCRNLLPELASDLCLTAVVRKIVIYRIPRMRTEKKSIFIDFSVCRTRFPAIVADFFYIFEFSERFFCMICYSKLARHELEWP